MEIDAPATTTNIFNNSNMDYYTFMDIDNYKHTLLKNLPTMDVNTAILQTISLLTLMLSMMEKYFREGDKDVNQIQNQRIDNYNLYDLQKALPYCKDTRDVLKICYYAFTNFNILNKQIGNAIPTQKKNFKKKLMDKLFSIAKTGNRGEFANNLIEQFKPFENYKLDFYSYLLSRMPNYDLDSHNLIIGFARVGKSTLALQIIRRMFAYRLNYSLDQVDAYMVTNNYVNDNIIYDNSESVQKKIATKTAEPFLIDEAYMVGDRRMSMDYNQIKLGQTINKFAYKNHTIFTLIQNLSDLDVRFLNKANSVIIEYERGKALLFAKEKHFAIIKDTYGFEFYTKHPHLLNGLDKGLFSLKGLPAYVCSISWEQFKNNSLYDKYLQNKKTSLVEADTFPQPDYANSVAYRLTEPMSIEA